MKVVGKIYQQTFNESVHIAFEKNILTYVDVTDSSTRMTINT
jgi:hypothetical protein